MSRSWLIIANNFNFKKYMGMESKRLWIRNI